MFRISKSRKTENRLAIARGLRGWGIGTQVQGFFLGDGNALELDSDHGCITW